MDLTIHTIGVYGWTEESFRHRLVESQITAVVDVRMRRGVRGQAYSFANSQRLKSLLASARVPYLVEKRLAPDPGMRAIQKNADASKGQTKRGRSDLAPEFVKAYLANVLETYSIEAFRDLLLRAGPRPAFLCVERDSEACHRGVLAQWARQSLSVSVIHLSP